MPCYDGICLTFWRSLHLMRCCAGPLIVLLGCLPMLRMWSQRPVRQYVSHCLLNLYLKGGQCVSYWHRLLGYSPSRPSWGLGIAVDNGIYPLLKFQCPSQATSIVYKPLEISQTLVPSRSPCQSFPPPQNLSLICFFFNAASCISGFYTRKSISAFFSRYIGY